MTQQDDRAVPVSEAAREEMERDEAVAIIARAVLGTGIEDARYMADGVFDFDRAVECVSDYLRRDRLARNALTPPAQSSGPGEVERLRSAMLVTRGSIGDLRKGFAKSVDPERWVQQAIAHIDKALTPNASEPQPGAASSVDVLAAGPRDCMWRSGHDGAGSDPSRFFCDVIGPAPSCHLYRAVADTEAEARAIAFQKADPSFAATAPTVGNIILVSQNAEPGYQLHGLFRSFKDAANHAAKDEDNKCMPAWSESYDRQQWVTTHTVWVASRQPVRPPAAALSDPQGVRDDG